MIVCSAPWLRLQRDGSYAWRCMLTQGTVRTNIWHNEGVGSQAFRLTGTPANDHRLQTPAIWLSFGEWEDLTVPIKKAGIKLICQIQHLEQVEPALCAGAEMLLLAR